MSLRYRADIDGLRAIAVIAIVAFHVGLPGSGGGFVGVDVFFVISGFLITGLLAEEIAKTHSIDLRNFYARRVRRLLPALSLVTVVTLIAGFFLLNPLDNPRGLANSAIATAAYVSNIYFWLTTGYFERPAEEAPLLHTWSLGVEEQYYLVWPLLMLLAISIARKRKHPFAPVLAFVLVAVLVGSFGLCWWGSLHHPSATFYLLPTRAWEFAVGGLLSLFAPRLARAPAYLGSLLTYAGLIAIAVAVSIFNRQTTFPGVAALVPTLGAACVIAGGSLDRRPRPTMVLGSSVFVGVGLLSYSWYLWHWPLLSFGRLLAHNEREVIRDGGLVLAALALAWATYRYLENPVRIRAPGPFRSARGAIATGVCASVCLIVVALMLRTFDSYPSIDAARYIPLMAAKQDLPVLRKICHQHPPFVKLNAAERCLQGFENGPVELELWGDSHAENFAPLIATFGETARSRILQRTFSACPPILDVEVVLNGRLQHGCRQFNDAVLGELEALGRKGLKGVVLSARWPLYLKQHPYSREDKQVVSLSLNGESRTPSQARELFETQLRKTLGGISRLGLRVLIVAPMPELRYSAPRCLARHKKVECGNPRREQDEYRLSALTVINAVVGEFDNVRVWDPVGIFCDESACRPTVDQRIAYSDDDHITASAARSLLPHAQRELSWLIGRAI